MKRTIVALLLFAVLAASGAYGQNYVKWNQPPDPAQPDNLYYGWNELSVWGGEQIAADDWFCETNDPVSDIHWWGSFIGWNRTEPPQMPGAFHFAIWTDEPNPGGSFSHPGYVVWEYVSRNYTWEFAGWDFDPRTGEYEACFLFHCDLPLESWFYQEPGGTIYWLSIAADHADCPCNADIDGNGSIDLSDYARVMAMLGMTNLPPGTPEDLDCDGDVDDDDVAIIECQLNQGWPDPACCPPFAADYPFGWKTRPRLVDSLAPDAAVRTFNPTQPGMGDQWTDGQPIRWPGTTPEDDWDLAFYLTTSTGMNYKWQQPPVFDPESPYPQCYWGWDEISNYEMSIGPIVADDWVCSDPRPITDVHWWGSYLNWEEPPPPQDSLPIGFDISIWTDVPAGVDEWFSHPGMLIWSWYVPYPETMEMPVGCDFHPAFTMFPETCYYYSWNIPEDQWFWQEGNETIYWISISALYYRDVQFPWGWKTRPRDPASPAPDDAVRIFAPREPVAGSVYEVGEPIFWPNPEFSWDMAFELSTIGGQSRIKWYQPPEPYVPDDAYNGWNELSIYGFEQIAGDDWVCQNEDPITDVHWWGSFIGWGHREPPADAPTRYHIGIWTDVPADVDDWFSHPGTMLWQYECQDFDWQFAGWDFDPRDPLAAPEACFYFTCDIPREAWFYQEPGDHIYWVTISAIYDQLPCACNGDLNEDGVVNAVDLNLLLACFGTPTPPGCEAADLDCDGDVDSDDVTIFQCQFTAGWPDPDCCPNSYAIENPFGLKTRPRSNDSAAPDDAVAVLRPTDPVDGSVYELGRPLFWPTELESWDICFQLTATHEEPSELKPKWTQPPACFEGFDAESNLWMPGEQPWYPKWTQLVDLQWPGMHCDDTMWLGDDWQCGGGMVTDIHWFGNYENNIVGVGLRGFTLSIYADAGGMPAGPPAPPLWTMFATLSELNEMMTGDVNSEGCFIYRYEYYLPIPFPQEQGQIYWLVIAALPNSGNPAPQWRWQEAGRRMPPILNPAVYLSATGGWTPLCWADDTCSDFAFIITSNEPGQEVNKVEADDFYSDGHDILDVRWWGSYFDERYAPHVPADPLHQIDGWLISFHYADVNANPQFPPDILFDPPPTALALYFAPYDAVEIYGLWCTDCLGHPLFEYHVDLDRCCLLCSHPDPRNNYPPPGLPGVFQEIRGFRYWLDVVAVTGVTWTPDACQPLYTDHIPPFDTGGTGAFWGWHMGFEPAAPGPLNTAATGRIMDFSPYPPDCWDYGQWRPQPWECPTDPLPVNMAFELLASNCPENLYEEGLYEINLADLADLLSRYNKCVGQPGYLPQADFNNDGCITLSDLAQLLSVYGQPCPTW